ncbi:hypothetical protein Tco_1045448 [Tanacetum coccineum]|uniref:Uncharacterized protein n=1 Tax=Tanacetum coccineum TaxID=301880 RepID=A0ABQ5GT67_9ASTR
MTTADAHKETERVKVNCTLEDTLQQASTSGTQIDNALVYRLRWYTDLQTELIVRWRLETKEKLRITLLKRKSRIVGSLLIIEVAELRLSGDLKAKRAPSFFNKGFLKPKARQDTRCRRDEYYAYKAEINLGVNHLRSSYKPNLSIFLSQVALRRRIAGGVTTALGGTEGTSFTEF